MVAALMALTPPTTKRLSDSDAEDVRRNHERRITELQQMPAASMVIVRNVALPSGTAIPVAHGLGREPRWVGVSLVRGSTSAGAVSDLGFTDPSGNPIDRSKVVMLFALAFGSTVTVDVAFL